MGIRKGAQRRRRRRPFIGSSLIGQFICNPPLTQCNLSIIGQKAGQSAHARVASVAEEGREGRGEAREGDRETRRARGVTFKVPMAMTVGGKRRQVGEWMQYVS